MNYWPKCFHYRHEIRKIIFLDRSIRSGTQYMQAILVSQLKSSHTCSIYQDSWTETCYQEKNVGFKDKLLMNSIEESRQAISFHWFVAHCRKRNFWKKKRDSHMGNPTWVPHDLRKFTSNGLLPSDTCPDDKTRWLKFIKYINNFTMITLWKSKFESQNSLEKGYSSEHLRVLNLHELKRDPSLNIQNWSDNWRVKSGMRKHKLNKIDRNHQVR